MPLPLNPSPPPFDIILDEGQVHRILVDMGVLAEYEKIAREVTAGPPACHTWMMGYVVHQPSGRRDASLFVGTAGFENAEDNGNTLIIVHNLDKNLAILHGILKQYAESLTSIIELDPGDFPTYFGDVDWGLGSITP